MITNGAGGTVFLFAVRGGDAYLTYEDERGWV